MTTVATQNTLIKVRFYRAGFGCPNHAECPDHGDCYYMAMDVVLPTGEIVATDNHHIWGSLSPDAATVMRDRLIFQFLDQAVAAMVPTSPSRAAQSQEY